MSLLVKGLFRSLKLLNNWMLWQNEWAEIHKNVLYMTNLGDVIVQKRKKNIT